MCHHSFMKMTTFYVDVTDGVPHLAVPARTLSAPASFYRRRRVWIYTDGQVCVCEHSPANLSAGVIESTFYPPSLYLTDGEIWVMGTSTAGSASYVRFRVEEPD